MDPARNPSVGSLPRYTILSVTTVSSFMAALDSNIVTIALPSISKGLSSGISLLGWVVTGYLLAAAALFLQSGKLGDRYGRKNVYLVGFSIFGVASALCGFSQNAYQLIAFRILQGAGASFLMANALPLVFASFPPSERGAAVGVNSVAWAVGAVVGPLAGGILASVTWRLIFYVNIPFAVAAIMLSARRIPNWLNSRNENAGGMNLVSSALLTLTIAAIMVWLTLFNIWLAALGAIGIIAFIIVERRSSSPLLNRELITNRGFVFTVVALGVMQVAFFGVPFVMSFYLQSVAGFSPLIAALWLLPLATMQGTFNIVSGRVFDRMRGPAATSIIAAVVAAIALAYLSLTTVSLSPRTDTMVVLGIIGIAWGFVWTPSVSSALSFSSPELRGVANGTMFTLVYVGFAASVSIVVSVSATSLPPALAGQLYLGKIGELTASQALLFGEGLSHAFLTLAAISLLGIPILLLLVEEQRKHFQTRTQSEEEGNRASVSGIAEGAYVQRRVPPS